MARALAAPPRRRAPALLPLFRITLRYLWSSSSDNDPAAAAATNTSTALNTRPQQKNLHRLTSVINAVNERNLPPELRDRANAIRSNDRGSSGHSRNVSKYNPDDYRTVPTPVVWLTFANVLTLGAYTVSGVGGWIAKNLEEQLYRWIRAVELTCDRAALLDAQDPKRLHTLHKDAMMALLQSAL